MSKYYDLLHFLPGISQKRDGTESFPHDQHDGYCSDQGNSSTRGQDSLSNQLRPMYYVEDHVFQNRHAPG